MNIAISDTAFRSGAERYKACVAASKRVRWDIDADVIRGRRFDLEHKFLPDALSGVEDLTQFSPSERRYLSQIQGRTYANMFGLVERFISAKVLEVSRDFVFADQVALEALVRFSDEELKHQELFRRVEAMVAEAMPPGYRFDWRPNEVAGVVLGKSTWAVLALTLHIELFTQTHFRQSVEPDPNLSPLWKDVFLYHWREECQHAVLDELEWRRCDLAADALERDRSVDEFIELVGAVDGILQGQAEADAAYFLATIDRQLSDEDSAALRRTILGAYRWQYILSGAEHPHFLAVLCDLTTPSQQERIMSALAPLR